MKIHYLIVWIRESAQFFLRDFLYFEIFPRFFRKFSRFPEKLGLREFQEKNAWMRELRKKFARSDYRLIMLCQSRICPGWRFSLIFFHPDLGWILNEFLSAVIGWSKENCTKDLRHTESNVNIGAQPLSFSGKMKRSFRRIGWIRLSDPHIRRRAWYW